MRRPEAEATRLTPSDASREEAVAGGELLFSEANLPDDATPWTGSFVCQMSVWAPPAEAIAAGSECLSSVEPTAGTDNLGTQSAPAASAPTSVAAAASCPAERLTAASFRAVWEVDCLGLPPVCRKIVETVGTDLQRVCQQLSPTPGTRRNLVSIDSCSRGEGRTTVALALAHGLAQAGQKIALVDADFGHPRLASELGLAIRQGWEHSVLHGLPIQECCIYSIGDGFTVLPLGSAGLEVNDLMTLQRIQGILQELSEHFDRVLLDQGPGGQIWVALPPQRLLAHVLVRSLRQTSAGELQRMLDRIKHPDDVLVSLVDNFATPSALAMAKSA